ncbi:MAG: type II toxin-antitoxin system PemK/MazF family toxin [Pseudomonadota bacterium]
MICDPGDVVVVPFPFSDLPVAKPRPALVISPTALNETGGTTLLAMITTAAGGLRSDDTALNDLQAAGLKMACVLRLKLFTLDNRLIAKRVGRLSDNDRKAARRAVGALIAL